jgi:hypothetical protein
MDKKLFETRLVFDDDIMIQVVQHLSSQSSDSH